MASAALVALPAVGCGGKVFDSRADDKEARAVADPRFPYAYDTSPLYVKLSKEPIYRPADRVARELYGRATTDDMGPGTLLIKEEYALRRGVPGKATVVAVMRRMDDPTFDETDGWSFEAYDGKTHVRLPELEASCVGCHTLRREQGFRYAIGHTVRAPRPAN